MIYERIYGALEDVTTQWSDLSDACGILAGALGNGGGNGSSTGNGGGALLPLTVGGTAVSLLRSPAATATGTASLVAGWQKQAGDQKTIIVAALANLKGQGFVPVGQLLTQAQGPLSASNKILSQIEFQAKPLFDAWLNSGNNAVVAAAAVVQARMGDLRAILDEGLGEIGETSPEGGYASLAELRNTADDISTYPVWTQDTSAVISSPPTTPSGGGSGGSLPMGRLVEKAMSEVLGRRPRIEDTDSFVSALNQSFKCSDVEGHTVCTWVRRAASGVTELGASLTGAQASLYQRAKVTLDNVTPLVDSLMVLRDNPDPEDVDAVRSIVRSEFAELVGELGAEGGPRVARVDDLFDLLMNRDYPSYDNSSISIQRTPNFNQLGLGEVGRLGDVLGMTRDLVNTVEEEQNLTNYLMIKDYINSLSASWQNFRSAFTGGVDNYLGTQLVLITRSLSVVAEQVDEVSFAMDSVFLGAAERQTTVIDFPDPAANPPMYVADLLGWIRDYCTGEGTRVIQDGGKIGVRAVVPTLTKLGNLAGASRGRIRHPGGRHPRVLRTLDSLKVSLADAARLAGTIQ